MEASFDKGFQNYINSNDFTRLKIAYSQYDVIADDLVLASHGFAVCRRRQGADLRSLHDGSQQ